MVIGQNDLKLLLPKKIILFETVLSLKQSFYHIKNSL